MFAATLADAGIDCAAADRGWTGCHQIWAVPALNSTIDHAVQRLKRCHIIANNFNRLPGISQPAFRLSSAEFTRLGATGEEAKALAEALASALLETTPEETLRRRILELRSILNRPRYCFEWEDLLDLGPADNFQQFCFSLFHAHKGQTNRKVTDTSI